MKWHAATLRQSETFLTNLSLRLIAERIREYG